MAQVRGTVLCDFHERGLSDSEHHKFSIGTLLVSSWCCCRRIVL